MSEIKRYKMEFAPGSGGWIKQTMSATPYQDNEVAKALARKLNAQAAYFDALRRALEASTQKGDNE